MYVFVTFRSLFFVSCDIVLCYTIVCYITLLNYVLILYYIIYIMIEVLYRIFVIQIFFPSLLCLFIFLVVSFEVEMFFILMKYYIYVYKCLELLILYLMTLCLTQSLEILHICSLWRILIVLAVTFRSVVDSGWTFDKHLNSFFCTRISNYTNTIGLKYNWIAFVKKNWP